MKKNKRTSIGTLGCMSILLVIVFVISLLPILYASFYAHPVADDYGYSLFTHDIVLDGGGIFAILIAACKTVQKYYFTWQGTFSAIFLFSLQPGIFSQDTYFMTTFIMIGILIVGTYFLLSTIITKLLKERKVYAILISFFILFMSVQFVPNKAQTFYWYNGSVYYTFFYSLAMIFVSTIIRLYLEKSFPKKFFLLICSWLLAFIIGGGNYTTALFCTEIMVLSTIFLIYKKDRNVKLFLLILIILLLSLGCSIIAPGNAVRAAKVSGMSPIFAIVMSIFNSFYCIGLWTALPQIVYLVFITPILYRLAKYCNWKFRYPLIMLGLFFLLFASQMTPAYYAMSNAGAGRQTDIYYYSYYLLITLCDFYVCGWVTKKAPDVINDKKMGKFLKRYSFRGTCMLVIFFCIGCINLDISSMTSIQTGLALVRGKAAQYDQEYKEVIEDISSSDQVCITKGIDEVPEFLPTLDLTDDPEFWVNRQMAEYFHVDKLIQE